jgi:prepilin-type N-terminal cleavage/methylation domain-containing protein
MVTKNKVKGFTIVELLIVIVIIGILAAITVVSFSGITAKANTASEQSAANAVISKALVYKASVGQYPIKIGTLTGLATTDPAYLSGVTNSTSLTAPASPYNTVQYLICASKTGNVAASTYATDISSDSGVSFVSTTTVTGIIAKYWDFTTGAANQTSIYDGQIATANGVNVGCVASAY